MQKEPLCWLKHRSSLLVPYSGTSVTMQLLVSTQCALRWHESAFHNSIGLTQHTCVGPRALWAGDGKIGPARGVGMVAASAAASQIPSRPGQSDTGLLKFVPVQAWVESREDTLLPAVVLFPEETSSGILTGPESSSLHFSAARVLGAARLRIGL